MNEDLQKRISAHRSAFCSSPAACLCVSAHRQAARYLPGGCDGLFEHPAYFFVLS
jgi:hypothetical protein